MSIRSRVKAPTGAWSDVTDQINALRYSNVNPGGFEAASFDIPAALAPPKGSTLQISDEYGIAWEGRIEENDIAVSGASDRRGIAAYGFGVLLKRTFLAMDFVQSDLSKWFGPPLARRAAQAASYKIDTGEVADGTVRSNLAQPTWTAGALPVSDLWYKSPGPIGKIMADWARTAAVSSGGDPNHIWAMVLSSDDVPTSYDGGTNLQAAGPGSASVTSTTSDRRYALLQYVYNTAYGTDDSIDRSITWSNVKVLGKHSLTVHGTGADAGLYGGDIVGYLIGLVSGVNPGTIDAPTSWTVSQLALESRAMVEEHLIEMNRQFGYDWGTWDSGDLFDTAPRFNWTAKQTSAKWKIRRSNTRGISLGSSLDRMGDTIYVRYTDPSGNAQELTDTSSVRALTDAGISQPQSVDAGLQVAAGAQRFADLFFELQGQDPPLTGSIELAGKVDLVSGGSLPAHHMRADGSLVRVEDLLPITEVYDLSDLRQTLLPIKRVETDASGEIPVTTLSIDQSQDALSVLTARFGASDTTSGF